MDIDNIDLSISLSVKWMAKNKYFPTVSPFHHADITPLPPIHSTSIAIDDSGSRDSCEPCSNLLLRPGAWSPFHTIPCPFVLQGATVIGTGEINSLVTPKTFWWLHCILSCRRLLLKYWCFKRSIQRLINAWNRSLSRPQRRPPPSWSVPHLPWTQP